MVFYLATQTLAKNAQSNVTFAVIYGLGMLPGALGRCDGTHIAGYLLTILICAMLLSRLWVSAWRVATIAFASIFLIVPYALSIKRPAPALQKALFSHLYNRGRAHGRVDIALDYFVSHVANVTLGNQRGTEKMGQLRNSYAQNVVDPRGIFSGLSPVVAAPFAYFPNHLSNYQAPWIDEGYFMGTLNVLTRRDVARKVGELETHPDEDLVVPGNYCEPWGDIRVYMEKLLLVPWVPHEKHSMTTLDPYCAYIHENYYELYSPSDATFGYGVLRRKPGQ
jgi:hypothetical protein